MSGRGWKRPIGWGPASARIRVGCGQLIYAKGNDIVHVEGDPRNPINQGTLCPKGAGTLGWLMNPDRLTKVRYRAPYSTVWEERDLDWAMDRIAHLVKQTRRDVRRETARRECGQPHAWHRLARRRDARQRRELSDQKVFGGGLGMVWIENQARICHSGSVPSLGSTYGRGTRRWPSGSGQVGLRNDHGLEHGRGGTRSRSVS